MLSLRLTRNKLALFCGGIRSIRESIGWHSGEPVSLHLFPRFVGPAKIGVKAATFGQATWGFSVLLGGVGSIWSPVMTTFGYSLLGIAFIWFAVIYLRALLARNKVSKLGVRVPRASLSAWYASWIFFLAFGFSLVFGLDPLSLAALHLLFLAFVTNLVYGVGYMLFPLLLRRKTLSETLAMAQVVAAILGAFLMVFAFLGMLSPYTYRMFTLLGIGGTLAAISAIATPKLMEQFPVLHPSKSFSSLLQSCALSEHYAVMKNHQTQNRESRTSDSRRGRGSYPL